MRRLSPVFLVVLLFACVALNEPRTPCAGPGCEDADAAAGEDVAPRSPSVTPPPATVAPGPPRPSMGCVRAASEPARTGVVAVTLRGPEHVACQESQAAGAAFVPVTVPPRSRVAVRLRDADSERWRYRVSLQRGCGASATCLTRRETSETVHWSNPSASPEVVVAVVSQWGQVGRVVGATLELTVRPADPEAFCDGAPPLRIGATRAALVSEGGEPLACDPDGFEGPALHYALDVPPRRRVTVRAQSLDARPMVLTIEPTCDATRCLAFERGYDPRVSYQNDSDAPQRVYVSVAGALAEGTVRVRVTEGDDVEARVDGLQPPTSLVAPSHVSCQYHDGQAPSHEPDEVSSDFRLADVPLAWSLGPDDVLWLSHPALEGRTLVELPGDPTPDLLVTRSPDGRVTPLARGLGVVASPEGLVATGDGVLMVARVTASASVSGRALGLPAGLALLRFDGAGALAWAEATPTIGAARAFRGVDGVARLLVTTTAAGALRGVGFGGPGRLALLRFDGRGAPIGATDLGAAEGSVDELMVDDDGTLRLRSGESLRAFTGDGAPRWQATLPAGAHLLRRDGTAWTAAGSCEALGAGVGAVPAPAGHEAIGCVTVLASDGRGRAYRVITRDVDASWWPSAPLAITIGEALRGAVVVSVGVTVCSLTGSPVSPTRVCEPNRRDWAFTARDPDPLFRADASPRCWSGPYWPSSMRWGGGVRCLRRCAASGTCAAPPDLTTDANCGALGRSCDVALSPLHLRGRCAAGECAATGCAPGWGDCNGDLRDGCEVDLARTAGHCGACGNGCAGRCEGGRCCGAGGCATGVFDGDGREGPFTPTADVTLPSGVHRFTRIHIPEGVTVRVDVGGVLDLRATEEVRIEGTIDLTGGDGDYDTRDRGGATGRRVAGGGPDGTGSGGGGGASLRAPARGEAPGDSATGYSPDGCGGSLDVPECPGQPRSGRAGAEGYDGRSGGGTYGCSGPGYTRYTRCNYEDPGAGSIGPRALRDFPVLSRFEPGSGGGSTRCVHRMLGRCLGPASGGGGGGALRIASRVSISLGPGATVRADGGQVPFSYEEGSFEMSGGHGSGGVVSLAAPAIDVARGAYVSAASWIGGLGRVKLSVDPARCRVEGTFVPPLPRGCVPSTRDALCETYVARWPE